MTINVNISNSTDTRVLKIINKKLNKIMATQEQITAVLTRINDATDNIAQDLRDLRDQIANGGLTGEQEASVLSQLEAAASKLEGIAADPENPVPDEPVDPTNPDQPVEPTDPNAPTEPTDPEVTSRGRSIKSR